MTNAFHNARPPSPVRERTDLVAWIAAACFALAFGMVAWRVIDLQASPDERLEAFIDDRTLERSEPPVRGDLLDRRGRVLATTRIAYRVVFDPEAIRESIRLGRLGSPHEVVLPVARASGLEPDDVGTRFYPAYARNTAIIAERESKNEANAAGHDDGLGTLERLRRELGEELQESLQGRLVSLSNVTVVDGSVNDEPAGSAAAGGEAETTPEPTPTPRPTRYVPMRTPIGVAEAAAVRSLGIAGVTVEPWPIRERAGGVSDAEAAAVAPVVGLVGFEKRGVSGAELAHDRELTGSAGRLSYARDARGRPLWVRRGSSAWAVNGRDRMLSIDAAIQAIALEELEIGIAEAGAAGGRLVALDPWTGEVFAMVDIVRTPASAVEFPWVDPLDLEGTRTEQPAWNAWTRYRVLDDDPMRDVDASLARNRCVTDVYEPGSTFKPFVWAEARALGLLPEDEIVPIVRTGFRTSYGRRIHDVGRVERDVPWTGVLVRSSNQGMSVIAERMAESHPGRMRELVLRMGFGAKTGLGLPGEQAGFVTSARDWREYTQTSVSFGQEIAVTPAQLARAYAALARSGEMAGTVPDLRLTAATSAELRDAPLVRVLDAAAAREAAAALEDVAGSMDAGMRRRGNRDGVEIPAPRYRIFGKSGTAQIPLVPPVVGGDEADGAGAADENEQEADPRRRLLRPRWAGGYYPTQYFSSFIAAGPVAEPAVDMPTGERLGPIEPRLVVLAVIDDPEQARVRRQEHYGSVVAGPVVRRVLERSLRYMGVRPSVWPEDD